MTAREELLAALADGDGFHQWIESRGFAPASGAIEPHLRRDLREARVFEAPSVPGAPRILAVWRDTLTARSTHGRNLRDMQRQVNALKIRLAASKAGALAPELCLIGCPDFLMAFPVDGDAFARRQRFTPEGVARDDGPLADAFRNLHAERIVASPDAAEQDAEFDEDDDLRLLFESGAPQWRKDLLYAAELLDRDFVRTMSSRRLRLVAELLRPQSEVLLRGVLERLDEEQPERGGKLDMKALLHGSRVRNLLIAVVDNMLLRLVLRRYLEAHYGPDEVDAADESRTFARSTDDAVDRTFRFDPERQAENTARIRRERLAARGSVPTRGEQRTIFGDTPEPAAAVTVDPKEADGFRADYTTRRDHYQRTAGGDLHLGRVAEAADLFEDHLVAHRLDLLGALLHDTRADRYSFHWADLDPKAFQEFYEQTIGTDIRLAVSQDDDDPAATRVRVVPFHRTRKEQGAFYTHARLCDWLVKRTLGAWFDGWFDALMALCQDRARPSADRVSAIRSHLDRLLDLRVIDPTCGGGIFLRAAFQYLIGRHEMVAETLAFQLPKPEATRIVADERYARFASDIEPGEWEWYVLLHMLYGVDIDLKAIIVASNLLTLSSLAYKPGGLRFPSFINANLKRGNALVVPFTDGLEVFASTWRPQIVAVIHLRTRLRDPTLPDAKWSQLHAEARAIIDEVVAAHIKDSFGEALDAEGDELMERVAEVGAFLYPIEFPEVFFDANGDPLANPGFDFVLGNPPWEEPAAEFKHFLPEFDPEYRELGKRAALEREKVLLADPEIKRRWDDFRQSVDDYKALLSAPGLYTHQRAAVHGRIPGAHTNLYKYATERSWRLLADGGRAGLVLDGGLWHDVSATGLRRLLLDQCRVDAIMGFNNNRGLFPEVHRSYKFSATIFTKTGEPTEVIPAVFMRTTLADLEHFHRLAAGLPAATLRADAEGPYKLPEVRSAEQWHAFRAFDGIPRLGEEPWHADTYSRELNAGEQRHLFHPSHADGFYPLIQGAQFNLFGAHQGELPDTWVDPGAGGAGGFLREKQRRRVDKAIAKAVGGKGTLRERAKRWLRKHAGQGTVPDEWLRLDWDDYRLAWRNIARNDDRRTLIAGILPPRIALSHTALYVRPYTLHIETDRIRWTPQFDRWQLLYLAGMLASFACDAVARTRLAKTHMTTKLFLGMPVPRWEDAAIHRRIAELCCDLTCLPATPERPWADYTALAAAVGRDPATHGLTDPADRREAEIELNAHAAQLYGLDRAGLRYLMDALFMTPRYADVHRELRDAIAARLSESPDDG